MLFFSRIRTGLLMMLLLVMPTFVSAQSAGEPAGDMTVIATTEVYDAQIMAQNGSEMTIFFNLYNAEGVQPGIVYGVKLYQVIDDERYLIDTQSYADRLVGLGADETLPVSIDYTAPGFLSGEYEVWVVAENTSGLLLATNMAGVVTLEGTSSAVVVQDCGMYMGDSDTLEPLTDARLSGEESVAIRCTVVNSGATTTVYTDFETHKGTLLGPVVEGVDAAVLGSATLGSNEIGYVSVPLPTTAESGSYESVLVLVDEAGDPVVADIPFRFTIGDELGRVQNVTLDAGSYAAGDTAAVTVTWFARPTVEESQSVAVSIYDTAGTQCGTGEAVDLGAEAFITTVSVPITGACANPQIGVQVRSGEKTLAADSFGHVPPVFTDVSGMMETQATKATPKMSGQAILLLIVVLFAVLTIAALIIASIRKSKRSDHNDPDDQGGTVGSSELMSIAFAIIVAGGVLLGVGVERTNAATLTLSNGLTFTVSFNKGTYNVGEALTVTTQANPFSESIPYAPDCGDRIAPYVQAQRAETVTYDTIWGPAGGGYLGAVPVPNSLVVRSIAGYSTPGVKSKILRGTVGYQYNCEDPLPPPVYFSGQITTNFNVIAPPSATITGTGCTIQADQGTCNGTFSWNIQNASFANVLNSTTNGSYGGPLMNPMTNVLRPIGHGTNVVVARDNSTVLASVAVTGSCVAGTVWNAVNGECEDVSVPPPPPVALPACTLNTSDATITTGQSTTLLWDVTGGSAVSATINGVAVPLQHNAYSVTPPSTTNYVLRVVYSSGIVQCSRTITVSAPVPAAWGNINGAGCFIGEGESACNSLFTWTTNALWPFVAVRNADTGITTICDQMNTNLSKNCALPHGDNTVSVRGGTTGPWLLGNTLDYVVVEAECEPYLVYDGANCIDPAAGPGPVAPPPTLGLTADGSNGPITVTEGDSVYLEWSSTDVDSCIGSWGVPVSPSGDDTEVVLVDTTFTLDCVGDDGSSITESVVVNVNTKPNLVPSVSALTPSATFNPVTGTYDNLSISYSIVNEGESDAGHFVLKFELDFGDDGVIDDILVRPFGGFAGLSGGGGDTGSFNEIMATDVPFGTHSVKITVDSDYEVDEGVAGESDNIVYRNTVVPVPNPGIELNINPKTVKAGLPAKLDWNTHAVFPMDCEVAGPGITTYSFDPSNPINPTGELPTGPVIAKSEFILTCTEPTTGAVYQDTAIVETTGIIQET